jgi:hypothetical protein
MHDEARQLTLVTLSSALLQGHDFYWGKLIVRVEFPRLDDTVFPAAREMKDTTALTESAAGMPVRGA